MDAADMIREAFANERALEGAALAAMPWPAVKVKPLGKEFEEAIFSDVETLYEATAITPAPDLAAENERLRAALEFVQLWAWRDDPPNAARNLSDSERLSAIKYHPSILPGRAALERT